MKHCTCQRQQRKAGLRWLFSSLGLLVLVAALVLLLSRGGPQSNARGIVILATSFSNGEQVVTFRLTPLNSEVAFADIVSVADDGSTQPLMIRHLPEYLGGSLVPARHPGAKADPKLHYLALPKRGASIGGRAVPYTPGSYTVAYSPTTSANRVRAGVALERTGLDDWRLRLQKCWYQNNPAFLFVRTHGDPVCVTSEPITNAAPYPR